MADRLTSKAQVSHLRRIAAKGGRAGARLRKENPKLEAARKERWRKWWDAKGNLEWDPFKALLPIRSPRFSEELAEFVGIMMGDGTVAPYHIAVTLNTIADKEYIDFVAKLISRLFGVEPRIYKRKDCNAADIVVHRKNLVEFCKKIGLKQGNKLKQGLDLPEWTVSNQRFLKACLRGLFDTDGCLFEHSYLVNGKRYSYLKLSFTSRSPTLLDSVRRALSGMGFSAKIRKNGYDVKIESMRDVSRFMRIIGTSNPRRKRMFDRWKVAPNGKATVC